MEVTPHLMFCGQCEEAFRFYEHSLRGRIITMLTYGNSPMAEQVPLEWRNKIIHASLTVAGGALTGADVLPEQYQRPQGFYVLLGVDEPADAERIFDSLAERGVVGMPIQQTFWSVRFGVVVDRFGIPWEISCGQVAPHDKERQPSFK
jgi:PhnB protein